MPDHPMRTRDILLQKRTKSNKRKTLLASTTRFHPPRAAPILGPVHKGHKSHKKRENLLGRLKKHKKRKKKIMMLR